MQSQAGDLAATAAGLVDALMALQRSRHDELAADRMGVEYAARAGYDPNGLLSFFNKIRETKKRSWFERLFATHPPAEVRIERAKGSTLLADPPVEILIAIGDRLAAEGRYNRAIEKYRAAAARHRAATVTAKLTAALAVQKMPTERGSLARRWRPGAGRPAHRYPPAETERARQAAIAVHGDLLERQQHYTTSQKLHRSCGGPGRGMNGRSVCRQAWWDAPGAGLPLAVLVTRCLMLSARRMPDQGSWRATRHGNGAMGQASSVCLPGRARSGGRRPAARRRCDHDGRRNGARRQEITPKARRQSLRRCRHREPDRWSPECWPT